MRVLHAGAEVARHVQRRGRRERVRRSRAHLRGIVGRDAAAAAGWPTVRRTTRAADLLRPAGRVRSRSREAAGERRVAPTCAAGDADAAEADRHPRPARHLLDEAARRELTLRETLALLCEAEVAHRDERRIQMGARDRQVPVRAHAGGLRLRRAALARSQAVRELATCRWVANGDALLLLGPPGVGKTHLAVALGREAIQHGYSALFTPATALVTALTKAHAEGRLEERLTHYAKPKLLIVDEFGYLPLEPNAAHLFFQLVIRRYERG